MSILCFETDEMCGLCLNVHPTSCHFCGWYKSKCVLVNPSEHCIWSVRECYNIALSLWFVPAIITAFCYEFREREENKEKDAGKNGPTSRGKHSSASLQNVVMWWRPCFAGLVLPARYIKELYWKAWGCISASRAVGTVNLKHADRARESERRDYTKPALCFSFFLRKREID